MPPKITRNHEYAKVLARTVKTNRGFTSLANKVDAIDSADVTQILSTVSASSLEVYDTLDSLPTSSLTKGGQGYVKATQRLYISDSFGWYSMALVNLTPTQTLDPSGNITLSTDGTSTIVTITATDSDQPDAQLSYSIESDGNMLATGTTVTQDSSVFTITPLSEDSGGVAGNFTLTFKTTDSVNIATTTKDFSLTFAAQPVSGSASTVALIKADGNSKTNSDITYTNSSNTETNFTETGDPTASTFSPYRSGGYSGYFDGSGDYLEVDLGSNGGPDGDCTFEFWVHYTDTSTNSGFFHLSSTSGGFSGSNNAFGLGKQVGTFRIYKGSSGAVVGATAHADYDNTWVHLALVRSSGTVTLYINGVADANTGTNNNDNSGKRYLAIGGYSSTSYLFTGFLRDFRYVKGTAVYTSNFTPPTEPLTAIPGTQFLMGGLPYFADQSSNGHSIGKNGDACLKPFGPYDYLPWAADDNVGSVHFDGNDYMLGNDDVELGSSNFTIECWYYKTANIDDGTLIGKRGNTWISGDWLVQAASTNQVKFWSQDYDTAGATPLLTGSAPPGINKWVHVAVTRSGNTWTLWVDGTSRATRTWAGTIGNHANPVILGADLYTGARLHHSGYIADCNVHVGVVKYSSAFTPPTSPVARESGSQTKFQMQNKSDANIYDAAAAYGLSLYNGTVSSTTQRKFTTSSAIYFDGTNDYIRKDDVLSTFRSTASPFTIEGWVYWHSTPSAFTTVVGINNKSAGSNELLIGQNANAWKLYINNTEQTPTGTITDNTWYHFAFTYDASNVKFYVDGTQTYSAAETSLGPLGDCVFLLGTEADAANGGSLGNFGGIYLQDLRISHGVRYTANFTPPTTEFEL